MAIGPGTFNPSYELDTLKEQLMQSRIRYEVLKRQYQDMEDAYINSEVALITVRQQLASMQPRPSLYPGGPPEGGD